MELPRLFQDPFRRLPPNYRAHLGQWFDSPAGERLLAAQAGLLNQVTPCIFGYHAIQLCAVKPVSLLVESRILHRVLVSTFEETAPPVNVLCDPKGLPFASDSTDLLILHHALDFEDDPYTVLREAARVVIPGGALVVVGFNPWSLFGFLRWFRFGALEAPWFARCISAYRVSDWLRLLDFRVDGVESSYYLPPLQGEQAAHRLAWLDYLGARWWPRMGMFYVLVARKSVAPLTPVRRPERQSRSVSVGVPVASRVTRHNRND
ncbi:MAG: class I SAM-dependent methyltransferase [Pseudomonadota bacterium]